MKNIVVIGGGSGTYQVLKGLKKYTSNLTGIFTMFDSGGSSGLLRDEFGYLPPGDVRRGILALSSDYSNTKMLRELFNYRFSKGNGLKGHNFGNLLLTALKDITGSELEAIKETSKLFHIKGKVLPITIDQANLCAELEDGTIIIGENNIDIPKHNPILKIKRIFLDKSTKILGDAVDAILSADLIVIGPGDLFTSLIPNLIVEGTIEAIKQSKAKKVYICNIMTKNGETNDLKASDFIKTLEDYLGKNIIDYFIINNKKASKELLEKYNLERASQVEIDKELDKMKVNLIIGDFINETDILRHDSEKLAKKLIELS